MQLNVFFLLMQYTALKVYFSNVERELLFFSFHCLDSEKRIFRARHVKMINNNFFSVFNQDAGVFFG